MFWFLLLLILVERVLWKESFAKPWLPWWIGPMMLFCLWGWFIEAPETVKWGMQVGEFKVFLLLVPFFAISSILLRNRARWDKIILTVFIAGVWVAGLGALEYFYPASRAYMKGFMVEAAPVIGEEGFLRAPFTFWGSPDAAYVCMVSAPLFPPVWSMSSNKIFKVLALLGGAVLLVGIYISGHRSAWLLLLLVTGLWVIFRKGVLWGLLSIVLGYLAFGIAIKVLPQEAADRFQSGISVIEGKSTDSSGKKRWTRAEESFENVLAHPLGRGWAAAGWVHNDFLMVTENLGIPGGLFFFAAFCITLVRLFRFARSRSPSSTEQNISISLLLSLFVAGWLLAFDCTLVLTQLALPVWTAWVLGETWLHYNLQNQLDDDEKAKRVRSRTDIQFVSDTPENAWIAKLGR
jgi:hypothetical protein